MSIPAFDPLQYQALQRHEWGVSAAGWQQHWAIWERAAQHVNTRLVELAQVDAGHRVLDIATGLGEPAFTAARRVGPSGLVVATDVSPQMLALAQEGAIMLGLQNIEFREMDSRVPRPLCADVPDHPVPLGIDSSSRSARRPRPIPGPCSQMPLPPSRRPSGGR